MGMLFAFVGVAWVVMCIAMSIDAYQTEFDSGIKMGIWEKVLLPAILVNPGLSFIVEGLRIAAQQ